MTSALYSRKDWWQGLREVRAGCVSEMPLCFLMVHRQMSRRRRHACLIIASLLQASAPRSYAPVTNTKDNPPCNTLFIGNLSEHTSEDELRGIFQGQPGELFLILAMAQQQPSSAQPPPKTKPGWVARRARFSA